MTHVFAPFTLPLRREGDAAIVDANGKTVLVIDPERDIDDDRAVEAIADHVFAMLAAAPGEVTNDDAPTYMRLAQALSRHPEVMVVERSDPTLELTPDSLEHLLDDVFPLAALSPEAPAREGVDYEIDRSDALTPRQMDALHDAFNRVLAGDFDGEIPIEVYERAYDKIGSMGRRIAALNPRHEAPASEGGAS